MMRMCNHHPILSRTIGMSSHYVGCTNIYFAYGYQQKVILKMNKEQDNIKMTKQI